MKPSVALIGPGKVGGAVGRLLHQAGYRLSAVVGRNQERAVAACRFIGCVAQLATTELSSAAKTDILLLAVGDDAIQPLAAELQQQLPLSANQTLLHFSGLYPAEVMRQPDSPVQLASLHPLLPFASRELATEKLKGCPCAIEGDASALPLVEQLVKELGGRAFPIEGAKKALYHTSACIASNFLVTLLGTARDLLSECGIAKQDTLQLLRPLLQATLDNAVKLGPEVGLTGPIVRGDQGTVARHLQALTEFSPADLPLYRLLGERTAALAEQADRLPSDAARQITDLLKGQLND